VLASQHLHIVRDREQDHCPCPIRLFHSLSLTRIYACPLQIFVLVFEDHQQTRRALYRSVQVCTRFTSPQLSPPCTSLYKRGLSCTGLYKGSLSCTSLYNLWNLNPKHQKKHHMILTLCHTSCVTPKSQSCDIYSHTLICQQQELNSWLQIGDIKHLTNWAIRPLYYTNINTNMYQSKSHDQKLENSTKSFHL